MKRLGELFNTDRIPGFKEAHARHAIAETVSRVLGVPVTPRQVSYKEGAVTLGVAPVVKSAVLLNAEKLRTELLAGGISVSSFR